MRGLAFVMALLVAGTANAGDVHVLGVGGRSCGTWTAERSKSDTPNPDIPGSDGALAESAWVFGFLSGIGFVAQNGDDPVDDTDADAALSWVDDWCRAHPVDTIADAAATFYFAHPHR
jgi:hypothetical protein